MTVEDRLQELLKLKEQAKLGGGPQRIDAQHSRGKLTARERLEILLDEDSFEEMDTIMTHRSVEFGLDKQKYYGDAVVTGFGTIDGRLVYVFSQDFTVFGGSLSEAVSEKITKVMHMAIRNGAPVVGLNDSGGARIQEGVVSLKGYGDIFALNVQASGVVPQISAVMGPCAGGAAYSPALTDFIFMVNETGQMYITGPEVVKATTGEEVTHEQLGGAMSNATRSGVAHFAVDGEEACLLEVRRLLSYLPANNLEDPPAVASSDDPRRRAEDMFEVVPEDPTRPYDVRDVILRIADDGDFMEVHEHYAQNVVVGFSRMASHTVGIVANQPLHLAGALDIDAARKIARFVRFCDAFNVPILTLVDVPGYLPGLSQEYGGIIAHGAKIIYAYTEATVPKVTVTLRKAYGGAYVAMGSKHLRVDVNLAWPTGEFAVMGPEGAVNIIFRNQLSKADDAVALRAKLVKDYKDRFASPLVAASRGYIDDVIDPRETRYRVIRSFEMLRNKTDSNPAKKHGTMPL
ncbi:MAG: methylmalonyl-CoA carboxyltransferase [Dehalococcoidia bacterium]|nr:methylmalonyl-CoA carboxyltransferase [Dehalococcoidia bacterium]